MNSTLNNSYTEVSYILDMLGTPYKNKLPTKILDLIYKNKNSNYEFDKTNISRNALIIISILNLKYWENNEDEKIKLKKIYARNEKIYQDKINEYKNENWLKKDKKTEKIEEVKETSLSIIEDKSIWNKIKKFIKNIFNKWKWEIIMNNFIKSDYTLEDLEEFRDKNGFIDLSLAGIQLTDESRETKGTFVMPSSSPW